MAPGAKNTICILSARKVDGEGPGHGAGPKVLPEIETSENVWGPGTAGKGSFFIPFSGPFMSKKRFFLHPSFFYEVKNASFFVCPNYFLLFLFFSLSTSENPPFFAFDLSAVFAAHWISNPDKGANFRREHCPRKRNSSLYFKIFCFADKFAAGIRTATEPTLLCAIEQTWR